MLGVIVFRENILREEYSLCCVPFVHFVWVVYSMEEEEKDDAFLQLIANPRRRGRGAREERETEGGGGGGEQSGIT